MANRFNIDHILKTGVTYSPESFQESMFLPLQYRERHDKMLNAGEEIRIKAENLKVPDNKQAKEYFNNFKNKTNEAIGSLVNTINSEGVMNPNVASKFSSVRQAYNSAVSEQGKIGQLVNIANQIEQQRGLRQQFNISQGYNSDAGMAAFQRDVDKYFSNVPWEDIDNSNYQFGTFQAGYAPKNTTVENIIKANSGLVGSFTDVLRDNTLKPEYDYNSGIWTLNSTNASYSNSSNRENLNALSNYLNLLVKDDNSELMQSEYYRRGIDPETATEEEKLDIKRNIQEKVLHQMRMMDVTNNQKDTTKSMEVMNTINMTSDGKEIKDKDKEDTDANDAFAKLIMGEAGNLTSKMTDTELIDIVSGKGIAMLERYEKSGILPPGMTEAQFGAMKNKYVGIQRMMGQNLDDLIKAGKFNETGKAAFAKYLEGGVFSNSLLKENFISEKLSRYKTNAVIEGVGSIKEIATNEAKYNKFKEKSKKIETELSTGKNADITSMLNTKLQDASFNHLLDAYDGFNDQNSNSTVALEVTGGKFHVKRYKKIGGTDDSNTKIGTEVSTAALPKTGITKIQGGYRYVGKKAMLSVIAKNAGVSEDEMAKYLKLRNTDVVHKYVDGSIKTAMIKSTYDNGDIKMIANTYYLGDGKKDLEVADQLNKGLNTTYTKGILQAAKATDGAKIRLDTDIEDVNKLYPNSMALEGVLAGAVYKFEAIHDLGPGMKPEINISATIGEGQNKQTIDLFIPYEYEGKSELVDHIFNKVKNSLNPYDRGKIEALQENTKYPYLYVDNEDYQTKGTSVDHLNKSRRVSKELLGATLYDSKAYKTVNPIMGDNVKSTNLVMSSDGRFYSMNYVTASGERKEFASDDFIRKEMVVNNAENIKNYANIAKDPTQYTDTLHQSIFLNEMTHFLSNLRAETLKVTGVTKDDPTVAQFFEILTNPGNGFESVEAKYKLAVELYNHVKGKKVQHVNKFKFLK